MTLTHQHIRLITVMLLALIGLIVLGGCRVPGQDYAWQVQSQALDRRIAGLSPYVQGWRESYLKPLFRSWSPSQTNPFAADTVAYADYERGYSNHYYGVDGM